MSPHWKPLASSLPLSRHQQVSIACALLPVWAVWQLNGFYLSALGQMSPSLLWMADGIQWVLLPAILLGLLAHKASLHPRHYGLASAEKRLWSLAGQGLTVFLTAGLVFLVARNLSWRVLGPSPGSFQLALFFPQGLAGAAVKIYAAISAGLVESIFFIALPWLWYANARQRPSELQFAIVVSTIFALAHWEYGRHGVIAAFFAHWVMCRWFLHWRNLWPVVLGHTLIDLAIFA